MMEEQFKLMKENLRQVSMFVNCHRIPSSLVINWDQTGIDVVPSCLWLCSRGAKHVEIAGYGDKQQITTTFAATMSEILPNAANIWGKNRSLSPKNTSFQKNSISAMTLNHWANEKCPLRLVKTAYYVSAIRSKLNKPNQKDCIQRSDIK